jgi:hypothetical protein
MTDAVRIRDLLDLPEHVRKGASVPLITTSQRTGVEVVSTDLQVGQLAEVEQRRGVAGSDGRIVLLGLDEVDAGGLDRLVSVVGRVQQETVVDSGHAVSVLRSFQRGSGA